MSPFEPDIFDKLRLPREANEIIRDANPWWSGKPGRVIPPYRRWAFDILDRRLQGNLAPVTVLRGPRQVGKSTLQEQLIDDLLKKQSVEAHRILRVQFDDLMSLSRLDDPILQISRWYQNRILCKTLNESAHEGKPAFLIFDEVQNLSNWAPQIKWLVDHSSVHVLVTGSSSLRITEGKDSLAGRIGQIDLGPLLLREVGELRGFGQVRPLLEYNGVTPLQDQEFWIAVRDQGVAHREFRDLAFRAFSRLGGFPKAQANAHEPWEVIADQLNENVVKRAIKHDLRMGARGRSRDGTLLQEIFALACRYAGRSPSTALLEDELRRGAHADASRQRVLNYLRFLDGTLLLRLIEPHELRSKKIERLRKICLCDHAIRHSWMREDIPLDPEELSRRPEVLDLAGHVAESVAGYFLANLPMLGVSHFPARKTEPEVDFVIVIGEQRIPIEVKYRRHIDPNRDTIGLRAFIEKSIYNAPFGVLITLNDNVQIRDPRIVAMPLSSFLMMR